MDKISDLLSVYGNLQYNAGSYSQLSGEASLQYMSQAALVRGELIEAIVKYRLGGLKMTIEEIEEQLDRLLFLEGDCAIAVCNGGATIYQEKECIESRAKLLEAIKQFEIKAFERGYNTRNEGRCIAKDARGNIYELKEQECTARAKGQKTFKQVLDDNYSGII